MHSSRMLQEKRGDTMKLTEQHLSDEILTSYIRFYEIRKKEKVAIKG